MDLKQYLVDRKRLIDDALQAFMPPRDGHAAVLHEAMRYSLLAGGKRIRPILHLAAAEASGGDVGACMPFACALEMIHTYSLIHDDLPPMDDDTVRRGRPTNHVVFGEAVAILAGDALLTEAFGLIAADNPRGHLHPQAVLRATAELAHAAGADGMVGGQAVDVSSEGKAPEAGLLEYIHTRKTGALIRAAVRTGGILAGAGEELLQRFTRYGDALGLAFQVRDDLLNVEGDPEKLGKSVKSDAARGKLTYPALFGVDRSRARLRELVDEAVASLASLDQRCEPLREIARYVASRDH
jgi:geranylgeranyl diphosphate synthase type II